MIEGLHPELTNALDSNTRSILYQYRVIVRLRSRDWLCRVVDSWLFRKTTGLDGRQYWMTYRLPFGRPVVCVPTRALAPNEMKRRYRLALAHEAVHVIQWARGWLWFVRRYMTGHGRWTIEAPAYARSVEMGMSVMKAIRALRGYDTGVSLATMLAYLGAAAERRRTTAAQSTDPR